MASILKAAVIIFDANRMLTMAPAHCLENLSKAAFNETAEPQAQVPAIPFTRSFPVRDDLTSNPMCI